MYVAAAMYQGKRTQASKDDRGDASKIWLKGSTVSVPKVWTLAKKLNFLIFPLAWQTAANSSVKTGPVLPQPIE